MGENKKVGSNQRTHFQLSIFFSDQWEPREGGEAKKLQDLRHTPKALTLMKTLDTRQKPAAYSERWNNIPGEKDMVNYLEME